MKTGSTREPSEEEKKLYCPSAYSTNSNKYMYHGHIGSAPAMFPININACIGYGNTSCVMNNNPFNEYSSRDSNSSGGMTSPCGIGVIRQAGTIDPSGNFLPAGTNSSNGYSRKSV